MTQLPRCISLAQQILNPMLVMSHYEISNYALTRSSVPPQSGLLGKTLPTMVLGWGGKLCQGFRFTRHPVPGRDIMPRVQQ
jgi:hypothetical protein